MICRGSLGSNGAISTSGSIASFTRVHDETVFDASSWCCSVYTQSTIGAHSWTVQRAPGANDTCFLFDAPYPVNDLPAFEPSRPSNVSSGGDPCRFGRLEVNTDVDEYECVCDSTHSGTNCDFDLEGVIISMVIIGLIALLLSAVFIYRCGRRRAINDAQRAAEEKEAEALRVEQERYEEVAVALLGHFKANKEPLTEEYILEALSKGMRKLRKGHHKDDQKDNEASSHSGSSDEKVEKYAILYKLETVPSQEELEGVLEKMSKERDASSCLDLEENKVFSIPDKVHVFEIKVSIISTLQKSDEALSEESIHENLTNADLQKAISKEQILGFLAELRQEKKVVRLDDEENTVWTVPDKVQELTDHYLKGLFALLDANNSGSVDIYELGPILGFCGIDNDIHRLTKLLKRSQDNYSMHEHEFLALVKQQQWVLPESKVFGKDSMHTTPYLHYIFGLIDQDRNGFVDMKELMEALERCEIKVDQAEMLDLLPKPDSDAALPSVVENDFLVLVRQKEWLLEEANVLGDERLTRSHLREVFRSIDDNNNGRASLAELKWTLEHNNIIVDLTHLVRQMNSFETDEELGISEQDFISLAQRQRWILAKIDTPKIPEFTEDYLGKVFKLMDRNKNGRVCVNELSYALNKCKIETNIKQLVSILSKPGADENYGVREGDFIDIIRKAGWIIKEENLQSGIGSWTSSFTLTNFVG